MAWNPNGDDQNPWKKRPNQGTPPDLDEMMRKLKAKLTAAFGGGKGGGASSSSGAGKFSAGFIASVAIAIIVIIWAVSGIFIVAPAERAAIVRFGKYVSTVGPGPHWIPRVIESDYIVNVQQVSTFPYQAEMLTKDENIVSVAVAIQYRADNVRDYLFNVVNPVKSLQQATASALRQVVGNTTLDEILTTGRQQVAESVNEVLTNILKRYNAGLLVTDVTLQPAKPPEPVTAAFDDAIKAREDEQRFINQAQAYAERVVPIAQGKASRILQEADAARKKFVLNAKGNIAGYLAILPEYQRSPGVTRERLYLNTVQSVLSNSSKILVGVKGNNILYLPLDRIIKQNELKMAASSRKLPIPSGDDASNTTSGGVNSARPSYGLSGDGR